MNQVLTNCERFVEPSLQQHKSGEKFQFQRLGYFNVDKDG
jgi:glutaminyl-tRNA synthetase